MLSFHPELLRGATDPLTGGLLSATLRRRPVRIAIACVAPALLLLSAMAIPLADPPHRADWAGMSSLGVIAGDTRLPNVAALSGQVRQ